jgi:phospholipid/cholesterol/gamma-HCH transport system substrate-binding protein
MSKETTVRRLQGLMGLAIIIAAVGTSVGVYNHSFSRPVNVTFEASHAGLLLSPGSEVRLRGIPVGRVDSIASEGSRARLTLALDPSKTDFIPAGTTARITPSTVAGAPHVELLASTSTGLKKIHAGDVIRPDDEIPSVNDLFQQSVALLQAIPVDDLNATLSGLAAALDGRGDEFGAMLTNLNTYVTEANEHTPSLTRDIELAATVSAQYGDIARPLVKLLKHSTVTAKTIRVRRDDFGDLLEAGEDFAKVGRPFIQDLNGPLTVALRLLDPATALLAEYSPMFACTLKGMEHQSLKNVSLGAKLPGAQAIMTLLPGQRGYRYPDDLPKFADNHGPECFSLPDPADAPYPLPYRRYNDNSHANEDSTARIPLKPIEFFPAPQPAGGTP